MVIAVIGGGLLLFGGAAVVFQIAGDRGRDGSVWALLAIAASGLAGYLAWSLVVVADEPGVWAGFVPIGAAAAAHVVVAAVVIRLPPSGLDVRGSRWEMDILGGGREAEVATIELLADRLRVAREGGAVVEIPIGAIREARVDGETLRLSWELAGAEPSTMVLTPRGETEPRDARVRFCERLARRVQAMAPPG